MGRIILLTAFGGAALVALLYGIVLNGFGLFGPAGDTTVLSPNAPPKEIGTRTDPGVTGARAPAAKAAEPPSETAATPTGAPGSTGAAGPAAAPEPPEAASAPRTARNVTPPNVLSRPTSPYRQPIVEAEPEEPDEPPTRRYHRIVVEDAGTLRSGDATIRLAGIAPVPGDKTCTDAAGHDWPCGRIAAGALRMLIRNRAIDCSVVEKTSDGIAATCSVGLQDLNGWLVEQGWAEDAGGGYGTQAEAARAAKRGIHLAEWKDKTAGESAAQSLSPFTAPTVQSDPFSPLAQGAVESPADQGTGLVDAVQGDE